MADSVHTLFEELNDLLGVFSDYEGESSESDSDDEKRERRKQRKIRMQPFYAHRRDIFSIFDDAQVMRTFRFDKSSLSYTAGLIEELLPTRTSRAKRCLTPLSFQSVVGNVLKVSQRSVGRSIHAVADALCRISPDHININPNLLEEKRQFSEIAGMPGIIGCIDGTHVKISRPHEFEGALLIAKDTIPSMNSVSAIQPGSVHDSTVFTVLLESYVPLDNLAVAICLATAAMPA
ncbi:putative nuclease HARBI1 [Daphnia magna]|uniref:putative nuclease HARBI1 n=1 Tax=Daphnia magna TaxID=35525 RepID=UPI0014031F7D|nr:putative nuclease HARBI1 [Daphnia magna]